MKGYFFSKILNRFSAMSEVWDALRWPAVIALVALSAIFAGLTLGMLSLDKIELEVVAAGEDKKLADCARRIIPVRKNGNLLLCTFLVGNTACNSLSSILMADLEGGIIGFITSTILILFFAEIIPQAICSRYALQIGARVIFIVRFFLVLFYPLSKPISMILDLALGEEIGTIHTRQELSKLLQIHVTEGAIDKESGNILQGALKTMNKMLVAELMTPEEDCYMLPISLILDFRTVSEIFETGFSRIPVYDKDKSDVVAILFAKDLILVDPDDETPLRFFISIFGRPVESFTDDITVRTAFVKLRQGHSHLALVHNHQTSRFIGVITLEDIVEEIIQEDIVDETDNDERDGRQIIRRHLRSKFRLLNAHIRDTLLAPEEVKALANHLLTNIEVLRDLNPKIDRECMRWILQQATVAVEENYDKKIYEQGVAADFCVIVLTGRLEIISNKANDIRNDAGSLSVVAAEALVNDKFVPDFSALIGTEKARLVIIKRAVFDAGRKVYAFSIPRAQSAGTTYGGASPSPTATGADPNVRHAFAYQLFSRKTKKDIAKDPAHFISEPGRDYRDEANSEPPDTTDNVPRDDELRISYSTSKLPDP